MDEASRDEFESFVAGNGRSLLRYALSVCGNRADAEDLVQEALLRVGLRWRQLVTRGDPLSYARTIVVRLHISTWRRARRQITRPGGSVPPVHSDSSFERIEADRVLADPLATLGAKQRAIVVLSVGYGMSSAEVADLVGCRESTVRSQRSRALERLRRIVGDGAEAVPPSGSSKDRR